MSRQVVWLFGRGLSIGCGLGWDVPVDWNGIERCENITRIRKALTAEMDAPQVRTRGIRQFLEFLSERTFDGWQHLFLTTNWDYLLQREILRFIRDDAKLTWLASSHVFHLNGTVEDRLHNAYSSPFLLTEDSYSQRTNTVEANIAFNKMIWATTFVLVGMSFECATDKFLLLHLNKVEDDMPIGESEWIVVNPDLQVLPIVCQRIQNALPHSTVRPVCRTLDQWREEGFKELASGGIFVG